MDVSGRLLGVRVTVSILVSAFAYVAAGAEIPTGASLAAAASQAGPTNELLKPPLANDPREAIVRAATRSAYPSLFTASATPGFVSVSLLMNPNGTLFKSFRDDTRAHAYSTSTGKAFAAMGVGYEEYHYDRVQVDMKGGLDGATLVYVRAFYPKSTPGRQSGPAAPNDDPAVDRAIAERYFPDLNTYSAPASEADADFWVLLDRHGRVLATGRRYTGSMVDLKRYIESLYPGIRTQEFQPVEMVADIGRPSVVNFYWLAEDSPITDLSQADLSRRPDAAIYADVTDDRGTEMTSLVTLKFGSPTIAVCILKDLDLEFTAKDGGPDGVILETRVQHVAPVSPSKTDLGKPNARQDAWSVVTAPVRVRYGESAPVQVTDQNQKVWRLVLHPDRMQGVAH